jgi:hypothetical protein
MVNHIFKIEKFGTIYGLIKQHACTTGFLSDDPATFPVKNVAGKGE